MLTGISGSKTVRSASMIRSPSRLDLGHDAPWPPDPRDRRPGSPAARADRRCRHRHALRHCSISPAAPEAAHERVDVLEARVEPDRGAGACRQPEPLVQRHGAMMAGADRDPVEVEHRADVLRVQPSMREGQHAALLRRGADQPQARDLADGARRRRPATLGLVRVRWPRAQRPRRSRSAAPRATMPAMSGVPASKRNGISFQVVPSKLTRSIMSPPPW